MWVAIWFYTGVQFRGCLDPWLRVQSLSFWIMLRVLRTLTYKVHIFPIVRWPLRTRGRMLRFTVMCWVAGGLGWLIFIVSITWEIWHHPGDTPLRVSERALTERAKPTLSVDGTIPVVQGPSPDKKENERSTVSLCFLTVDPMWQCLILSSCPPCHPWHEGM